MKINVLGTEYSITQTHNDPRMENIDGFCDETTKEIFVETYEGDDGKPGVKTKLDVQRKKNVRHELVHAFLFECGLAENSPWAQNEELVDWIAIQGPKLYKAWLEAGAI
mgnify:CR=1 FL=1